MKTNTNRTIETNKDAINFIIELCHNNEAFHFDDDARDIIQCGAPLFTIQEAIKVNELIEQCRKALKITDNLYTIPMYYSNGFTVLFIDDEKSSHLSCFDINVIENGKILHGNISFTHYNETTNTEKEISFWGEHGTNDYVNEYGFKIIS
jgi:hypothetical protein